MWIKVFLAALLFAAPTWAAEPDTDVAKSDRSDLQIEAGRLGAMMSQGEEAMTYLSSRNQTAQPATALDTPEQARAAIYESLVSAVVQYN